MTAARSKTAVLFISLATLMLATRFGHVGTFWSLPDASWAVFFLAGFYLSRQWRWALPLLLAESVLVDLAAIRYFGVSNYCVTVAYWFIVPAYSALWVGGQALRRSYRHDWGDLGRLALTLLGSASVCFVLSNGSFYWLGGRVGGASFAGWMQNMADWYPSIVGVPCLYVGVVALLHLALVRRADAFAVAPSR